ncbi:MAG TPA: TIGR03905 family TSCPD domain-containing protein [Spirochaetales bacterium]|nr:TIGR03905 family TSCPD domain-containing protein [Spirochaetales bacterium]
MRLYTSAAGGVQKAMNPTSAEKTIRYLPEGTCSEALVITLRGDVITNAVFEGGCPGNLEGLSRLVVGMTASEAIKRLRGIRCGDKATSCPDQLARALEGIQ